MEESVVVQLFYRSLCLTVCAVSLPIELRGPVRAREHREHREHRRDSHDDIFNRSSDEQ